MHETDSSSIHRPDTAAGENVWSPLSGGRGFVRRDWQDTLAAAGLREAADFFNVEGEPLSKPGLGYRYRARVPITKEGEIADVYLKRFAGEPLAPRLKRWFHGAEFDAAGAREARVAMALSMQGIAANETIAWGIRAAGITRIDSFVVMAAAPGHALSRWAEGDDDSIADRAKPQWATALAEFIQRFHRCGWCHRDLYCCHLFAEERDGRPHFTLIDLQRVFAPRRRARRWQVKDLAQLNFSANAKWVSRSTRLRFIKRYLDCGKLTSAQKSFIRAVARKTERIARRERRSRAGLL